MLFPDELQFTRTLTTVTTVLAPLVDSEFKDTSDIYTADELHRTENVLDSPSFFKINKCCNLLELILQIRLL